MIRTGLAVFAGAIMAACALAQSQTNPQTPPNAAGQTATNTPPIPNGPSVTAELNGSVDSKKAKVGDKVEARTTEALKNGNDVMLPKGTKLIGHVTQATARAKGDSDSSLAIQFDKAEPKKEAEILLSVMILAVAPAAPNTYPGGSPSPGTADNPLAGTNAGNQTSPMAGSRQPNPNAGNYPTTSESSAPDSSTGPGVAGNLPPNSRGVYGLKDLKLMMNKPENGPATTVLTSAGKDVHLDSGTRLLLVATATAPAPSGQ